MAIVLIIAGTELELKVVLLTLTAHPTPIVVKEVTSQIIAGSKTTGDGSRDQNLQIKLTLSSLTIQDPRNLGYLKRSNLVLQEHRKKNRKGKWYLDSACSRHMTGDKQLFKSITKLDGGTVTFGDKSKGNVIGVGKVPLSSTCDVDEVYLVDELGYNLLSISQLCDNDYEARFKKHGWFIEDELGNIILSGKRDRNVYTIKNLETIGDQICLTSMVEDPWVWHRKLGHASMHTIQKLSKHDLVIGLPKLDFSKDHICDACQLGKQTRSSFKVKNVVSTSKPLQLLHMDLFCPTRTASIGVFYKKVQREKGYYISTIKSDHGVEFESRAFENFCNDQGISHNFSSPRSPQQNGVVECKNRTLQDMPDQSTTEERVNPVITPNEWKSEPGYPHKFIIGDPQEGITTRKSQKNKSHVALISQIEPKKVNEALKDSHWISAMKQELDQFERNEVWKLVPKPQNSSVVGTKWDFRNKLKQSKTSGSSPNSVLCEEFYLSMKGEFKMSMMGELTFFLGLQIKQSPKGIFICQIKYTKELIKNFGMEDAKAIGTLMSPTTMLDEDSNGKLVDETMYRGMIESLLYLTASRPDIMFSVCKYARFQSTPKESHLAIVKQIIRYLIGTSELGLWYDHSNNFSLRGFSDADFAGDKIDRKSTSGTCQLLGNALVSWHSKKKIVLHYQRLRQNT
ncbi:uncharacterized protein [Nicotiana tomentosiformis]|uniref:uncharacterized protein n=1 Tax=Nicotiana tomentosiformis TaxID=4098 RepID=UPI00388CC0CF